MNCIQYYLVCFFVIKSNDRLTVTKVNMNVFLGAEYLCEFVQNYSIFNNKLSPQHIQMTVLHNSRLNWAKGAWLSCWIEACWFERFRLPDLNSIHTTSNHLFQWRAGDFWQSQAMRTTVFIGNFMQMKSDFSERQPIGASVELTWSSLSHIVSILCAVDLHLCN